MRGRGPGLALGLWVLAGPATAASMDRGAALFRLPGAEARSCLQCHGASIPPSKNAEAFRAHVVQKLAPLKAHDLEALAGYVDGLREAARRAVRVERPELTESMRTLGYVGFESEEKLPVLRASTTLNAYELSQHVSGSARLLDAPRAPAGRTLELSGDGLTGVILPQTGIDPGAYVVTLRSSATLAKADLRLSLAGDDSLAEPIAFAAGEPATTATARFRLARPAILTLAVVPAARSVVTLYELTVAREPR